MEVAQAWKPKSFGAFYTPATIAAALAEWLVRTGVERILEPSVGEGALVDAAIRHAQKLNSTSKLRFTVCDINPKVIEGLAPRLTAESEVRAIDFLQLDPASTGLFQGVLTNPPFTRNHSLAPHSRKVLKDRYGVTGAAGLWVHFLQHSLSFLAPGGRLAAVIPASALFSNYGRAALERVCSQFAAVELREFVDKPLWVNGASERGAILLAEGYSLGSSTIPASSRWTVGGDPATTLVAADAVFGELSDKCTNLSGLSNFRIGAVTGCNRVFLLDEATRSLMKIDYADLLPVVSRARQVPGLSVSTYDLVEQAAAGERTWLLAPRSLGPRGGGIRKQLAKISASRRSSTLWFSKRDPWWKVDAGPLPDAIFTYMNDHGPRLVLTADALGCTNTLHCVYFRPHVTRDQQLAASLTLVSTFGQLAAERIGRGYGGGLLKFELRDARRMPVLPPQPGLEDYFVRADAALRSGNRELAADIADEGLIGPILKIQWRQGVSEMRAELQARRAIRRGTHS